MGKIALFKFAMKLVPIAIMVYKEIQAAKEDDGEVDTDETIAIIEKFMKALFKAFTGEEIE